MHALRRASESRYARRVLRAYGFVVEIAGDARVVDAVERRLGAVWRRAAPAARPALRFVVRRIAGAHELTRDGQRLGRLDGGVRALARLVAHETELALCERTPGHVFVHAGVVGWRGRAIVVPGRSQSGKSTLVAALVAAGASYCSDEWAVIDGGGRVRAYPAPLSLRPRAGRRARRIPARRLGSGPAARRSLPLGLVVVTRYRPEALWRPRRLSPGQALLALLRHTVSARNSPAPALDVLSRALAGAVAYRTPRGPAIEAARQVLALADRLPQA